MIAWKLWLFFSSFGSCRFCHVFVYLPQASAPQQVVRLVWNTVWRRHAVRSTVWLRQKHLCSVQVKSFCFWVKESKLYKNSQAINAIFSFSRIICSIVFQEWTKFLYWNQPHTYMEYAAYAMSHSSTKNSHLLIISSSIHLYKEINGTAVSSPQPRTRAARPGETNTAHPEKNAKVNAAQPSLKSAHAVRRSLKLFSSCHSLLLISARLQDVLTQFGWAHAEPFDYKQPLLIVLIKRDLTHRCPSLSPARSHLATLSTGVFGRNEEASPEAISESIITSTASATAKDSNASKSVN